VPGNPLFNTYGLRCSHPSCGAERLVEQAGSAGWTEGVAVSYVPCLKCKRSSMVVSKVPFQAAPANNSVGFSAIPKG